MPVYFFNLHNAIEADDLEGTELPDIAAARAYACKQARDMVAVSVVEDGKIDLRHNIEVTDESGATVLTVRFGDVVRIERAGLPIADAG